MEPKQQTSYNGGRQRLHVPERGGQARTHATTSSGHSLKAAAASGVRRFLRSKKAIIITGSIVIAGGLLLWWLVHQQEVETTTAATLPEYQTILPGTKSISELGGWQRISPPGKDPVFAYTDKIGDLSITISQQPLPAAFRDDPNGQVAELAKKYNATTKIDAGGTKVYVGTSAKGPQSALLTKNGLLILIKSQEKIDDTAWASYVKSLN